MMTQVAVEMFVIIFAVALLSSNREIPRTRYSRKGARRSTTT